MPYLYQRPFTGTDMATNVTKHDSKRSRSKVTLPAYSLPATGDALIPDKKVAAALDCGVSTVWHRVANDPAFPRPVKLGDRCTRFSVAALREWIARRAELTASKAA